MVIGLVIVVGILVLISVLFVNLSPQFGGKATKEQLAIYAKSKNYEDGHIDSLDIVNHKDKTRLIWFGHSTFLMQMNNKNMLIDPMFGAVPAPHPTLGVKRFSKELPIAIEKLPHIDAVLISHDHYDHLDYGSIIKLKEKSALSN